jgi:ABC-type transport system substrate-binding protein
VIAVYFLFLGTYLAFTKEIPAPGGDIREAVVDSNFKLFNPVLELNSDAERKVTSLLFAPLYTVTFPDYLNDATSDPILKPVLLSGIPQWQDLTGNTPDNQHKVLRFELKNGIKWSDGSDITMDDVEYTFDRLKETNANSEFKDVFSKVDFVRVSANQFELHSSTPNPQLINLANFSPIPKDFFNSQSTDQLYTSFNSSKPLVTSGYFTFTTGQVKDPDANDNVLHDNPIREDGSEDFKTVILNRNPIQNTGENINVDRYIFTRYDNLLDVPGAGSNSLQTASKNGKVDVFTSSLGPSSTTSPSDLQNATNLNQQVSGTNTYYTLYLNIKRNDVFLNQQLRKYLICSLIDYQAGDSYFGIQDIPKDKRLIPIQFGQSYTPDCPNDAKDVLDGKNFKLQEDPTTGIKTVLSCGKKCTPISKLSMIGFDDSDSLITDLQAFLRDIGMPADVYKSSDDVQQRLTNKNYSLAFLPVTVVSRDPYPIFGSKARDLSQIRLNNQKSILDDKVEDNLYAYSISGLTDTTSQSKLIDFFKQEFVSINLFQSEFETNYSNIVNNISSGVTTLSNLNQQLYLSIPQWYVQTKREWK